MVEKTIIDQVGIDSILQSLNLQKLRKVDNKRYECQCPSGSHDDKNPSCSIYLNNDFYLVICFACGFKTSVGGLVKYLTGKSLFEYCNISGETQSYIFKSAIKPKKIRDYNKEDYNINKITVRGILHDISETSPIDVRDYVFKKRQISKKFIKDFKIKYCREALINGMKFTDRILIPIRFNNEIVSFEGRDFIDKQKKKVLYPKGSSVNFLWEYHNLKKDEPLVVVEGIMDIHKIYSYITKNVTTTFGITVTNFQKRMLNEFPYVILFPDEDEGGDRFIKIFEGFYEYEYKIARLPDKDPGKASVEEIKQAIDNAIYANEYFINRYRLFPENEVYW